MKHELTLLLHRLFQKFTSSQVSEVDRTRELVNIETCERLNRTLKCATQQEFNRITAAGYIKNKTCQHCE